MIFQRPKLHDKTKTVSVTTRIEVSNRKGRSPLLWYIGRVVVPRLSSCNSSKTSRVGARQKKREGVENDCIVEVFFGIVKGGKLERFLVDKRYVQRTTVGEL